MVRTGGPSRVMVCLVNRNMNKTCTVTFYPLSVRLVCTQTSPHERSLTQQVVGEGGGSSVAKSCALCSPHPHWTAFINRVH